MTETETKQVPQEVADRVEYLPRLGSYPLFISGENWAGAHKPTVSACFDYFQKLHPDNKVLAISGYQLDNHNGILLGPNDENDTVTLAKLIKYFRKDPEFEAMRGNVHPKVLGSRHEEQDPRTKYPFHRLIKPGDNFFIPDGVRQNISVYVANYCKWVAPHKQMRVHQVPGGVFVVLVYDPEVPYSEIVNR